MSQIAQSSLESLQALLVRQVELFHHSNQLRNFDKIRDRLTYTGGDPGAAYRKIMERHDALAAELRAMRPAPRQGYGEGPAEAIRSYAAPQQGVSARLQDRELVPVHFPTRGDLTPIFGYSGSVQFPRASEGVNVVPGGQGISGEIITVFVGTPGIVVFDGGVEWDSSSQPGSDPADSRVWLRNWHYLVPFPPPPSRSTFTYRFEVAVDLWLFRDSDPAEFLSFVSVGEEPNFTPGTEVVVDQDAGWPLIADLTEPAGPPTGPYNGAYGQLQGSVVVERSFTVQAGHSPAVAIVVGAAAIVGGRLVLTFGGRDSVIRAQEEGAYTGRISFHYRPILVASQ